MSVIPPALSFLLFAGLAVAPPPGSQDPGTQSRPRSQSRPSERVTYPADAAGLERLMLDLLAAQRGGATEQAAALTRGLLPDAERVRRCVADSAQPAQLDAIVAQFARVRDGDDRAMASLLAPRDPRRTEVVVHAATGAQLAGDAAFDEFPGGVREAARRGLLRANATYYQVVVRVPGEALGMKYHMLVHDGTGWTMLGKIWRL